MPNPKGNIANGFFAAHVFPLKVDQRYGVEIYPRLELSVNSFKSAA
jgi:hypothetical protein